MKMTIHKRAGALFLALTLCLSLVPAASAAGDNVTITDVKEFLAFAGDCANDTYSRGLTVELQTDLDLTGSSFTSIPVFCGTFHGNGHTITNYHVEKKGSQMGLFRYIEEGAEVSGLTIEDGYLCPGGSKTEVGLLAGVNKGTIEDCSVSGIVRGEKQVGGLVGTNEDTGVIRSSTSAASLTGTTDVGGIAGHNDGLIDRCANQGEIGREAEDDAPRNVGGIAGRSTGTIQSSENHAVLGYDHKGYNIGGIVGLQSGAVVSCVNSGEIYGRKDVGGIVGQFEPDISFSYGTDPIDALDRSMAEFTDQMRIFARQTYDTTTDAVDDMKIINDAMDEIRKRSNTSVNDLLEDTNAVIQTVHGSTGIINKTFTSLLDRTDAFRADTDSQLDAMKAAVTAMRKAVDDMADTVDTGLGDAFDTMEDSFDDIDDEMQKVINGMNGLSDDLKAIQKFLKTCESITKQIQDLIGQIGSGSSDDIDPGFGQNNYAGDLYALFQQLNKAFKELKGIDPSGHLDKVTNGISQISDTASEMVSELNDIYKGASKDARKYWDQASDALDDLQDATDAVRSLTKTFADASSGDLRSINSQLDVISQALDRYWNTIYDKGHSSADDIDAQLQIIQKQMDKMNSGASAHSKELYDTTLSILDQLDQVRSDLMEMTKKPERQILDVSDAHADEGAGRVSSCRNTADINADQNVGGIVGNVSMEVASDPEQEWDLDDQEHLLLLDTDAYLTATVRGSRNEGGVTAKKSVAGGIVGNGMVGAIVNCISRGPVEVAASEDDGGKAGGIAGVSRSVIKDCSAQADLTGGDMLGGIAGQGRDISGCVAMTRIDSDGGEQLGAIAGSDDSTSFLKELNDALNGDSSDDSEDDGGTIQGNWFLQESLAGVDGVTFAGQTTGLSFEDFSALSSVPAEFLQFSVTFVSNGQVVKTIPTEYGGQIDPADFPAVPVWNGYYGEWEDFDAADILRPTTVHAVYNNWSTTISSGGSQPVLLAEGSFSPSAHLSIDNWIPDEGLLDRDDLAGYSYSIIDPDSAVPETVALRVRSVDKGDTLYLLQDGALTPVDDAERDGSYLVFTGPASGSLVLVPKAKLPLPLVIGGGIAGVLILAAVLFLLIRRHKGKPHKGPTVKEKELAQEKLRVQEEHLKEQEAALKK
ncbi:peptidase [Pseudoflavonifractor sp. MSJ-37]|uniref:peptidase n=1 Tax=Pseudoflavonifractor sp. MSJ-37 TaxID=2841531 RepID=UPI001C0F6827|nr:peptidase [Pseudoflavonifractor sp. MSJ-37]MBU5434669.1 peptidase [Pseudoflavonifractor sp. MSJ-37]